LRDLLKRCDCPAAKWSKCRHGFHVRKQVDGHRPKISIDELVGHTRIRLVSQAEAVRDAVVAALRDRPAGTPLMPYLRAHPGIVAFRHDDPTRAVPAIAAAGSAPLAEVGAAYANMVDADPTRRPKYRKNVRSMVAVLTAAPLATPHAGLPVATPLGKVPVACLTDDLLEAFLLRLAATHSVSTRNKYLDFLRRLGRWTRKNKYRTEAWLVPGDDGPTRKKETRRRRRLQPGEGDRLLAVAGPLLRACIIAGVELGARLGELLRLVWADVDLPHAKVWVTDLKDPTRRRALPLSTRMIAVLEMRRTAPDGTAHPLDAFVFGNEVGERVESVYTAWVNAVLKSHGQPVLRHKTTHALLPVSQAAYDAIDLVFSDLRHEATSGWLDTAVPMHTIREWLGHTTFAMLSTYGHTTPEESARAMQDFERAQKAAARKAKRGGPTVAPAVGGPTVAPAGSPTGAPAGSASGAPAGAAHRGAAGKVAQSGPKGAQKAPRRRTKDSAKSLIH
jgi:integrase